MLLCVSVSGAWGNSYFHIDQYNQAHVALAYPLTRASTHALGEESLWAGEPGMPKVAVLIGKTGASTNGKLSLKCDVAERRVAVERGEGASRKIQFSSTFDASHTCRPHAPDEAASALACNAQNSPIETVSRGRPE